MSRHGVKTARQKGCMRAHAPTRIARQTGNSAGNCTRKSPEHGFGRHDGVLFNSLPGSLRRTRCLPNLRYRLRPPMSKVVTNGVRKS